MCQPYGRTLQPQIPLEQTMPEVDERQRENGDDELVTVVAQAKLEDQQGSVAVRPGAPSSVYPGRAQALTLSSKKSRTRTTP